MVERGSTTPAPPKLRSRRRVGGSQVAAKEFTTPAEKPEEGGALEKTKKLWWAPSEISSESAGKIIIRKSDPRQRAPKVGTRGIIKL